MAYFAMTIQPMSDEEGEECGFFDFNLVDRSLVGLRWYDGVSLGASAPGQVALALNNLGGWASVFPDYSNTPIPLMSERLVMCLRAVGVSNIEYMPAPVLDAPEGCPNYQAVNVVGSVKAADVTKSKFHRIINAPGADVFDELVLNAAAVGNLDLFRLAESVSTLIVSSRIRDAVERADFPTVAFEPLVSANDQKE